MTSVRQYRRQTQRRGYYLFTGTYNSAGPVSHVGIYCGNGVMIHCGDPIKYASINTSYWQSHFMPSAEYQEIKCLMIIKFDTMIIKTDIFIKKSDNISFR